jgi:hypothetical protein
MKTAQILRQLPQLSRQPTNMKTLKILRQLPPAIKTAYKYEDGPEIETAPIQLSRQPTNMKTAGTIKFELGKSKIFLFILRQFTELIK